MQNATVYVQASAHEGFGLSLAEAMACGCIPVGYNRGSIPEVIGKAGYIVPYGDLDQLYTSILKAIKDASDSKKVNRSVKRIKKNFQEGMREKQLIKLVRGITNGKKK